MIEILLEMNNSSPVCSPVFVWDTCMIDLKGFTKWEAFFGQWDEIRGIFWSSQKTGSLVIGIIGIIIIGHVLHQNLGSFVCFRFVFSKAYCSPNIYMSPEKGTISKGIWVFQPYEFSRTSCLLFFWGELIFTKSTCNIDDGTAVALSVELWSGAFSIDSIKDLSTKLALFHWNPEVFGAQDSSKYLLHCFFQWVTTRKETKQPKLEDE